MSPEDVKSLLEEQLSNAQVEVEVDGSHFNLLVVSEAFEGLRAIKKQQLVYGVLAELIADGSIHAVNMKTFTPAEWQQEQA